jgi:hypothetical protein
MWLIETTDTFDIWFDALDDMDRANVLASMIVLREKGPILSRPYADTVKGSYHCNMKELRIQSKGDPIRAFLPLIQRGEVFYCVLAIKQETINDFMRR